MDPLGWTCEMEAGPSAEGPGTDRGTSELAISAIDADSEWSSCGRGGVPFISIGPL